MCPHTVVHPPRVTVRRDWQTELEYKRQEDQRTVEKIRLEREKLEKLDAEAEKLRQFELQKLRLFEEECERLRKDREDRLKEHERAEKLKLMKARQEIESNRPQTARHL